MIYSRERLCLGPSSAAIWERTIQPARGSLDPAAAKALLSFKLSARDLDRADALARKAGAGKLTPEESAEIENYRSVGIALEFLKAKARLALKTPRLRPAVYVSARRMRKTFTCRSAKSSQ